MSDPDSTPPLPNFAAFLARGMQPMATDLEQCDICYKFCPVSGSSTSNTQSQALVPYNAADPTALNPPRTSQPTRLTRCGHCFCRPCLMTEFTELGLRNTCPMCRRTLFLEPEYGAIKVDPRFYTMQRPTQSMFTDENFNFEEAILEQELRSFGSGDAGNADDALAPSASDGRLSRRNNRGARPQDRGDSEGEGAADVSPPLTTSRSSQSRHPWGGATTFQSRLWGGRGGTAIGAPPGLFSPRGGRLGTSGNPSSGRGSGVAPSASYNPFLASTTRPESTGDPTSQTRREFPPLPLVPTRSNFNLLSDTPRALRPAPLGDHPGNAGRDSIFDPSRSNPLHAANVRAIQERLHREAWQRELLASTCHSPFYQTNERERHNRPRSQAFTSDSRPSLPASPFLFDYEIERPGQARREVSTRYLVPSTSSSPFLPANEGERPSRLRGQAFTDSRPSIPPSPYLPADEREYQGHHRREASTRSSLPSTGHSPFQTMLAENRSTAGNAPNAHAPWSRPDPRWNRDNWRVRTRPPTVPESAALATSRPSTAPTSPYTPSGTQPQYPGWAANILSRPPMRGNLAGGSDNNSSSNREFARSFPETRPRTLGLPPGIEGGYNRNIDSDVQRVLEQRRILVEERAEDEFLDTRRQMVARAWEERGLREERVEGRRRDGQRGLQNWGRGAEERVEKKVKVKVEEGFKEEVKVKIEEGAEEEIEVKVEERDTQDQDEVFKKPKKSLKDKEKKTTAKKEEDDSQPQ